MDFLAIFIVFIMVQRICQFNLQTQISYIIRMSITPMPTSVQSDSKKILVKSVILRMKIQRMIKMWKKMVKKTKQRINILKEWVVTQQAYIKDLNLIIQKIQKPMKEAELITPEEDRIIFPNLDAMLKLSKQLLTEVTSFLKSFNPHKTLIGASLLNFYKYFIIYREYCNNFYKSQSILKSLKDNPKLSPISSSLVMDIQSYTIKPVQRPPKYQLLLRQYLKSLPSGHPDQQPLSMAISKYHDVNEENNQSMDLQIRNEKMVELDRKYGSIINATRQYLWEEVARSLENNRIKLYVFNDFILVVRLHSDDREEGYKRIFLDGQSFVNLQMDGKYFINKLFICGNKQSLHCIFPNLATRDKVYERLDFLIHELYRKQTSRVKVKKAKTKMTVMKIQQLQIKSKPKLRITVAGVQKRPKSSLNLYNFDTFYILKIQAPFPSPIFQYSYLHFDELMALQRQLKSKNKMLAMPILDDRPDDMNLYDVKKNMTKIIQCREFYIERFINFVFRSQQLEPFNDFIANSIKINEDLWQFVKVNQPCTCQICQKQKENLSFQEFEQQKEQIKSFLGSAISYDRSRSSIQNPRQSMSSMKSESSVCFFNNFIMPNKVAQTPASQLNSLQRRMAWLQCKQGRIDYSLIPKNESDKNIKVGISLLSLKQDEIIHVRISRNSTCLEVIDQIADMYKIQSMRDFGLFIDYQGIPRLIDRDEKLWEALNQAQYQFTQPVQTKDSSYGIWKKLNSLKKWGEQMIIGKKTKLYVRKYLFVSQQLQLKACEDNPQRYSLLVQEVFYRFKYQILILNLNDTKILCAIYYIVNYMDKLAHLNEANFQLQRLKNLLPQSKWHLLTDQQKFESQVFSLIKQYQNKMQNAPLPVGRRSKGSTMFSKVQIVYACIIRLVYKAIGWNTTFFPVTNYDPPTLPGACSQLMLGVNRKNLVIIRPKQLEPLLQIELVKLDYKITFKSVFIYTDEKVLRLDGQMMYDVKKLIQIYKLMNEKFHET